MAAFRDFLNRLTGKQPAQSPAPPPVAPVNPGTEVKPPDEGIIPTTVEGEGGAGNPPPVEPSTEPAAEVTTEPAQPEAKVPQAVEQESGTAEAPEVAEGIAGLPPLETEVVTPTPKGTTPVSGDEIKT